MHDLDRIQGALARHRPELLPCDENCRRAAVAMVLAGDREALNLCFIRRAESEGDRWSGQMAFPGGRVEPSDADPRAAAIRETWEEVGLELDGSQALGAVSEIMASRRGLVLHLVLSTFVFYLGRELPSFRPNEEVAEAFWIPLEHLWEPANATGYAWSRDGDRWLYPGIRFRDQVIWGLTYRALTLFSEALDAPLARFEDLPKSGRRESLHQPEARSETRPQG